MIDLKALPFPPDAPPQGTCVRVERPEAGLAVLVLDPPHRKVAIFDGPLLRDLSAAIDSLEKDATLKGVVITGRSPLEFVAGADVRAIEAVEDPRVLEEIVRAVHPLLLAIERWNAVVVAAVGGAVPGGAYELCLACDFIVAADDLKTRIGLPETRLGILPAWGGAHRLPRRIGVPDALAAILKGTLYPAQAAWRKGMIDRLAKPENLLRVARNIAMGRETPRRRTRGLKKWLVDRNPLAIALIGSQVRKQVMRESRGHYPALPAVIDLVLEAPSMTMEQSMEREAKAAAPLVVGPTCKSLISIFFASEEAKKLGRGQPGTEPRTIRRAAVIGAGVMGGGIASLLAKNGIAVRLIDVSQEMLDKAVHEHRADLRKSLEQRHLQAHEHEAAIDRLETSLSINGLKHVDVVIEAVAEKLEVKKSVFAEVARQVGPDALLATNTSSLSVEAIASSMTHPERVVGMHFFNPVKKMPLVEVIRGRHSSERSVTETAALALRLGKTPVVVKDVAGFLVNRVLGPYLDEAVRLFAGGAGALALDQAMVEFGMPMGPLLLLDEVGFDIAAHAAASLEAAYGERMATHALLKSLSAPDRLGRKTGRGFFDHSSARKRKPEPCGDLHKFQSESFASALSREQWVERMVLSMLNEAVRCLEEGVVSSPQWLDLAAVFGTGFAPFRGGLLRYADSIGARAIVEKLEAIARSSDVCARRGGPLRFQPAALLVAMAVDGRRFYSKAVSAPERLREGVATAQTV